MDGHSRREENDNYHETPCNDEIQPRTETVIAQNTTESCSCIPCVKCGLILLFVSYVPGIVFLAFGIKSKGVALLFFGSIVLFLAVTVTIMALQARYQHIKAKRKHQNSCTARQVYQRRNEPINNSANPIYSDMDPNRQYCQLRQNHETFFTNLQSIYPNNLRSNQHSYCVSFPHQQAYQPNASQMHRHDHQVYQRDEPPSYQEILTQPAAAEKVKLTLDPPSYEDAAEAKKSKF